MKTQAVKIWGLPTRVFHWTLVAGIAFMYYSAEISDTLMDRHAQIGEFLLALILYRIIWGFVGSENTRFSAFVSAPGAVIRYAKTLFSRSPSWHAGHNPLGGWMVVVLLLAVLLQATTGLFASDDILVEGPLYGLVSSDLADRLTGIHHLSSKFLLAFIVLHISAILFYRFFKKTNLIPAIVKGDAPWPKDEPEPAPLTFRSIWLALAIFSVCYAVVYFGLRAVA